MQNKQKLILASSSPRRLSLLQSISIVPDKIISPNINEQKLLKEKPEQMALRLAIAKANSASLMIEEDAFIIAADTIVATKAKLFEKAESNEDAEKYLNFFSGRRIKVHSAVAVAKVKAGKIEKIASKLVTSDLKFKRISNEEMKQYLEIGEAVGKAGGFSIQGFGETLLQWISGSYSGIIGLPLAETSNLLKGLGYHGNIES